MSKYEELMKQADRLAQDGKVDEAISLYKEVIDEDPDQCSAYYNLAILNHRQGQLDEAITNFEKVAELDPGDASVFNNLGVLCYQQNVYEKAINYFKQAMRLKDDYFNAWYGLGKTLKAFGQPCQAISVFLKTLKIDPTNEKAFQELRKIRESASDLRQKRLNVGFVTIWFERGQAYVTKIIRDVVAREHETFIFARTGNVYGQPKLETNGFWDVSHLTTYDEYKIPHEALGQWIQDNQLDVVIFNEEYDWGLVQFAKSTGVKVLTYLDYYKEDWKRSMSLYDAVLCSTLRTYNLVKDYCNAHYISWAVDSDLFQPQESDEKFTFFHNAGWLGINYRKMTPAAILAFDAISRHFPDITLLVHAQAPLDKLPAEVVRIVKENPRITYHVVTVPAPGLYHKGRILLFPSKLEGLGLPLMEAFACGLPAIATAAPPMNEFVKDGYNGLLVRVAKKVTRQDNIAFPEEIIDVNDLAAKMAKLASEPELIKEMRENAREYTETALNTDRLATRVNSVLSDLFNQVDRNNFDTALKLHIGCGNVYKKGYVNIDLYNSSVADRVMDATKLDYSDDSVDLIESYHFIEHFSLQTGPKIMTEWYRVLKPGGKVIIECPNIDMWLKKYMAEVGQGETASWAPTPQEYEDWLIRMIFGINERGPDATHLCGYNAQRPRNYLQHVGFQKIKIGPGTDYHAEISKPNHGSAWFCLRAEAIKAELDYSDDSKVISKEKLISLNEKYNHSFTVREITVLEILEHVIDPFGIESFLNIGMNRANDPRLYWWVKFCNCHEINHEVLEIFEQNVIEIKNHNFTKVTLGDVRNIDEYYNKKFDVVLWWHGPEHINENEVIPTLNKIEQITLKAVILGCPLGWEKQGPVYGNDHEKHMWAPSAEYFEDLGYQTVVVNDRKPAHITAWKIVA